MLYTKTQSKCSRKMDSCSILKGTASHILCNDQILPKVPPNFSMYWKLVVLTIAHTKSAIGKDLEIFVI